MGGLILFETSRIVHGGETNYVMATVSLYVLDLQPVCQPAGAVRLRQQQRLTAPLSTPPGDLPMATLLLPCDGSSNALLAVRHVVDAFRRGDVLMVHLLNVQPPFSAYVARHVSRELRADFHRERADEALARGAAVARDGRRPSPRPHRSRGPPDCIADAARRLRCDRIVVGTARKSALVRAVENSLTDRVLERARCRSR